VDVLEYVTVLCPYCGEPNQITVERTGTAECYAEDCQVCCRSMVLMVAPSGDEIDVRVQREDD